MNVHSGLGIHFQEHAKGLHVVSLRLRKVIIVGESYKTWKIKKVNICEEKYMCYGITHRTRFS